MPQAITFFTELFKIFIVEVLVSQFISYDTCVRLFLSSSFNWVMTGFHSYILLLQDGRTALHFAATFAKEDVIKLLLNRKADQTIPGGVSPTYHHISMHSRIETN